jgi:RNA-directed DNA polymerase
VKVSCVEGVASHNGPESCGVVREDGVEALTGGGTGWVLSREMHSLLRKQQVLRGADVLGTDGRQHRVHRPRKVCSDHARSKTPCMCGSTLYGNREIPRLSVAERVADRIGKPKGERQ